ncbi:HSP20-like chaperone [Sporodiniella umbellata]|nr:HSP20-like chaperone [Sporodiniella umbellata]
MALSNRFLSSVFGDMQRAMSMMDQAFFNDVSRRSPLTSSSQLWDTFSRYPAVNIAETPQDFELHAEVPGYEKKDIQLELADSRTLILRGTSQQETSQESAQESTQEDTPKVEASEETALAKSSPKWIVSERTMGSFQRAFSFPVPIQAEGIKANYENGILKVTIPKAGDNFKKTIEIN